MKIFEPLKGLGSRILASRGLKVIRASTQDRAWPVELSGDDRQIVEYVTQNHLTMVSDERLYTTLMACQHVARRGIPGDFVECGVWRGGNSIVAADTFRRLAPDRSVYLFDTFAGMTAPSERDISYVGDTADAEFSRGQQEGFNEWCYAPLDEVRSNFLKAGLAGPNIKFVQGDVLETKRELEVLYPRLSEGGVLIIDDYGHWGGAKQAVDEYFETHPRPFLQYTDYTGRVGVKVAAPPPQ